MPKGGARLGSGQKPTKTLPFVPSADDRKLLTPPANLPAEQREFWETYAPLAMEKRTLTAHTVGGFRLLCELDAEKRAIKEEIERQGRTFIKVTVDGAGQEHQELKAHPLTSDYRGKAKHVETLMARFGLAPFGKAELPIVKKAAANPWAQVGQAQVGQK